MIPPPFPRFCPISEKPPLLHINLRHRDRFLGPDQGPLHELNLVVLILILILVLVLSTLLKKA